jgi:hypothetical protein
MIVKYMLRAKIGGGITYTQIESSSPSTADLMMEGMYGANFHVTRIA